MDGVFMESPRNTRVVVVVGTRPEAVKLAPVVDLLRSAGGFDVRVCATLQHGELLDRQLEVFGIKPDIRLDVVARGQDLITMTASVLAGLRGALRGEARPDLVLVQGDTTTTFAATLAAFHERIPVAHVEAGLRTGDLAAPWPEEAYRTLISKLAALHFAPTEQARSILIAEGVAPKRIHVVGNTVVDALETARGTIDRDHRLRRDLEDRFPFLADTRRLILVTCHRRENMGARVEGVCRALIDLARRPDVQIAFPVHPNPGIHDPAHRLLGGRAGIHLLPPQDYIAFVVLMMHADVILTDSGGIQEEAPTLGKPVLVLRNETERSEAVKAGIARLVGTEQLRITWEVSRLLDDPSSYAAMISRENPFGDGRAAERVVRILAQERRWDSVEAAIPAAWDEDG